MLSTVSLKTFARLGFAGWPGHGPPQGSSIDNHGQTAPAASLLFVAADSCAGDLCQARLPTGRPAVQHPLLLLPVQAVQWTTGEDVGHVAVLTVAVQNGGRGRVGQHVREGGHLASLVYGLPLLRLRPGLR